MNLIELISDAWGWTGFAPKTVLSKNDFGNLIVEAHDGAIWRICPEELSCTIIAKNAIEFSRVAADAEFKINWDMDRLTEVAQSELGALQEGRCYYFVIPPVLGGQYSAANMKTLSLPELIGVSGEMAFQIKDLPDGATIRLAVDPK